MINSCSNRDLMSKITGKINHTNPAVFCCHLPKNIKGFISTAIIHTNYLNFFFNFFQSIYNHINHINDYFFFVVGRDYNRNKFFTHGYEFEYTKKEKNIEL